MKIKVIVIVVGLGIVLGLMQYLAIGERDRKLKALQGVGEAKAMTTDEYLDWLENMVKRFEKEGVDLTSSGISQICSTEKEADSYSQEQKKRLLEICKRYSEILKKNHVQANTSV